MLRALPTYRTWSAASKKRYTPGSDGSAAASASNASRSGAAVSSAMAGRLSARTPTMPVVRWDLFCRVIDNLGDAGVCWRLAGDLAGRGESVRLVIDDTAPLARIAPSG